MALRKRMRQLRPQPTQHHGRRTPFRQQQLEQATHVFVRVDGVRKPLQHPYTGPHEVIRRESEHVYVIHINGREVATSTERLKPAFLPDPERTVTSPHGEATQSAAISSNTPKICNKPKKKVHFAPTYT
ncbi:hypothetical protein ALC57_14197 [Trachymyrmex cornetzi]|uniref:Uncharacterized protein n=1 Tax=Trachymyrmex cornetzi TaxID=471704 RepID=A0A151IYI2_9HYME|nr:hypothetical protein ALC57_14197 [Trachymyrmex cornetzi]